MDIGYVGGYWATNIGNSFFNLGAEYVLKSVFKDDTVSMIFDQPAGILRSEKKYGNPKRAINIIEHTKLDVLVLLGPVISKDFLPIWEKTLTNLSNNNVKYMILSCGLMKCSNSDLIKIKDFFKKNPPYLISTRDSEAYEALKDVCPKTYNGIDFAFFVPDIHKALTLDYNKLLSINFDKFYEPKISINKSIKGGVKFAFDGEDWELKFNDFIRKFGAKTDRVTDGLIYLLSVFPAKNRAAKVGSYDIIRTDHRFTPMLKNKVFSYSNSFVSDIPQTYLDIYANSTLTLSDRVHACVITLAYGNSAMLFSKTNRSKLLDRVGAAEIYKRPVKLNLSEWNVEKRNLIDWMKKEVQHLKM